MFSCYYGSIWLYNTDYFSYWKEVKTYGKMAKFGRSIAKAIGSIFKDVDDYKIVDSYR